MKRILSIILILLISAIALFGCGKNSGKQPQITGVEVELEPMTERIEPVSEAKPTSDENSVGLMAFYPNNIENMYALAGTNTFTVYFEKKRVKVGSGTINIYNALTNELYSSVNAANSTSYEISPIDDVGKLITGWEDGTKVDIYFDKTFIEGCKYYVLIDEGFFTVGAINSKAVTNSSLITFECKQYGVDLSNVSLSRYYNVGEFVNLTVLVDGKQATMYAIKEYEKESVEATPINGTTDTTLSLQFLKEGAHSVTVAFYNGGKQVDSISLTFNVGTPPEITVQQAPDDAIIDNGSGTSGTTSAVSNPSQTTTITQYQQGTSTTGTISQNTGSTTTTTNNTSINNTTSEQPTDTAPSQQSSQSSTPTEQKEHNQPPGSEMKKLN